MACVFDGVGVILLLFAHKMCTK